MKNRSKSWLCFHPGATMEEPFNSEFKSVYIAVKRDENSTIPRISSEKKNSVVSRSKKKSSRQAISRIVKAVFSETAVAKSRKVQQDPSPTLRSLSDVKSSKELLNEDDDTSVKISLKTRSLTRKLSKEDESTSHSCSSSSSSTSNLSSRKSSFRINSLEPKLKDNVLDDPKQSRSKEITNNKKSSINGLYLLLIILMVLIFWGRICAIICTSTWIYFGPFRRNNEEDIEEEEEVEVVVKPEEKEMESREYKKRVIMEGLLERTHSRF